MAKKTDKKSKTVLTGIIEPIPDNRPGWKADDLKLSMFSPKTVSDCIDLLRRDLWYWVKNQSKYPDEAADVAHSVKYHLARLAGKSEAALPPIPSTIHGLHSWVLFVDIYFCGQTEQANWKATVEAVSRSVKKRMTQEQVLPVALNIIKSTRNLTRAKLEKMVGCSKNTLKEVIGQSPELKKYFGVDDNKAPAPQAEKLTQKIIDETPAPEEPEPLPDEARTNERIADWLELLSTEKPESHPGAVEATENMELEKKQKFALFLENNQMSIKTEKTQRQYKQV